VCSSTTAGSLSGGAAGGRATAAVSASEMSEVIGPLAAAEASDLFHGPAGDDAADAAVHRARVSGSSRASTLDPMYPLNKCVDTCLLVDLTGASGSRGGGASSCCERASR
jgi:hypothetical protein